MVPVRPCSVKGRLRASTLDAQELYWCVMVKAVKYKTEFAKNYWQYRITAIALSITFVFERRMDIAQNAVIEYKSEVFKPVSIYDPT